MKDITTDSCGQKYYDGQYVYIDVRGPYPLLILNHLNVIELVGLNRSTTVEQALELTSELGMI